MAAKTKAMDQAPAPRSWTLVNFLPDDFNKASLKNLKPAVFPEGVFKVEDSSRPAVLTSPEFAAIFSFDELLLSADVLFPGGGAVEAEAQVKSAAGWSPWFSFGSFGPGAVHASVKDQQNGFGRMDIDVLKLKLKAEAFRYRLTFSPSGGKPQVLRLAAAAYSDSAAPYAPAEAAARQPDFKALKLALPRYSQMMQQVNYSGDICSPVSLAMAFGCLGLKGGPLDTAAAVLDSSENIYGNWFLNTAHAGSLGVYAFVARLNSLEEARAFLAAGAPVVASVTFGPDELKNSPLKKTKGHLLVITGFDARGNVITNDPAAPDEKTVERVYDRAQFSAAWLGNKFGTCYVLAKNLNSFLAVKKKVAEFYSMPPRTEADERAKLIESQLLSNERVELLEVTGAWARAIATEQHRQAKDSKTMAPYEGWLTLDSLTFSLPLAPNAVVRTKTAPTADGDLSLGVKVRVIGATKASGARILLGDGRTELLQGKYLNPLPQNSGPEELRKNILGTARLFMGDKYYWGGRSAWGIDCSGLVNISYRAWGQDLPRNADDQYAASKRVSKKNLKPADLIFSADAAKPGFINHVMLYAGAGRLIEATRDSDSVREVSFKEKFGADFSKITHGALVNGKKIFFGRILK